jgi:hypothetical protein
MPLGAGQRPAAWINATATPPTSAVSAAAAATAAGSVEQGVGAAYTVIETYLQRGRQEAERLRQSSAPTMGAMPGLSGWGGQPSWPESGWGRAYTGGAQPGAGADGPAAAGGPALNAALMQLVQLWSSSLQTLAPLVMQVAAQANAAQPPGFNPFPTASMSVPPEAETASAPFAASASPRPRTTVELRSPRISNASVSLEPGADLENLSARFAADALGAPAVQADIHAAPGQVVVRLQAEARAAAGAYRASVIDQAGRNWGEIALEVGPNPDAEHPAAR